MSSLQERKQQLVREAIWDSALDLFAGKGFDETSVEEIAEAAGVSRRTFFRYFESKNDLLAQCVIDYGDSIAEAIEASPRRESHGSVMRQVTRQVALAATADPRTLKSLEIAAQYPAARTAQLSRTAQQQLRLGEAWKKRGADAIAAELLASLTLTILSVTFETWLSGGGRDIGKVADKVLDKLKFLNS